ncbi:hypothetical protein CEXT_282991 [Caerostris extrusa]|uniref:Uncharacterized protein n=1 Tax=Caerostris extrusa TaxID=172846 RepID=A0AAV4XKY8_CAEEX|nr:hypothetical protein CEXT_282991 [Caerostris extrusa]
MAKAPEKESKNQRACGDDSDEESENLEESPCGRWVKKKRRDVWQKVSVSTDLTAIESGGKEHLSNPFLFLYLLILTDAISENGKY